ncbi:rhomboid family intramembrane serine protease [Zhihengliuella flava]|uniref:Membrane associated rhomboid family serine protease n=1 Tax=Zhihengliuella flava TaxID=1285193 RepID=A0A931GIW8_9MICC|nr:rhomboid family intramembrane serine protease [Zhihengliuella flava]MBG6084711.1 membrane associated rhomboid family serine protease [Zhihengliuella flava]
MAYGSVPDQQVPVCPRHPERPSYVRCQRCGQPTCGECQRPAAVGVQCVACVQQAAKSAPQVRTALGGKARGEKPVVTYAIIGLCAVVFGAQYVVPGLTERLLFAGVYTSPQIAGLFPDIGLEPWRMVTSTFLHSQGFIMHIAFNMYALFIIGRVLEPALGRLRFAAVYLISGFGGSVAVLLLDYPMQGVVGASGAVFGLFGALLVITRARGGNFMPILILIGINLVIGFIPGFNVSWQAHLGGVLTGAALAAVMVYAPRMVEQNQVHDAGSARQRHARRSAAQAVGTLVVVAVLVALTMWGASTVPARLLS